MATEEWRDIPGFPGYKASSFGRILGKTGREIGCFRAKRVIVGTGYGPTIARYQLIAIAFLPPKPTPNAKIDHINRVKHDDRPENLRWVDNRDMLSHSGNTHTGVKWIKPYEKSGSVNGRWRAAFTCCKEHYVAHFKTEADAIEWIEAKRKEVHKIKFNLSD